MNAYAGTAGAVLSIKIVSMIMVENAALSVVRKTGRYEIKQPLDILLHISLIIKNSKEKRNDSCR